MPPDLRARPAIVLRVILQWIFFFFLWLFFAFSFAGSEVIAAAVASVVALIGVSVALHCVPLDFAPRAHWIAQLWRLPAMIASDSLRLLRDLFRRARREPSHSLFSFIPFASGGDDSRSAAQRALALLFLSTSPNMVVLNIDRNTGRVLVHEIEPAPQPRISKELKK